MENGVIVKPGNATAGKLRMKRDGCTKPDFLTSPAPAGVAPRLLLHDGLESSGGGNGRN